MLQRLSSVWSGAGQSVRRLVGRNQRPVLDPVEPGGSAAEALVEALEASSRFRRDGRLGRIFHPGKVSYRELSPTNSLHVIVSGGRLSAHVDDICPLRLEPDGSARYSWLPVFRHNVAGFLADLGRRLQGRRGEERCNLVCEAVWVDDEGIAGLVAAVGGQGPEAVPCGHDHR